MKVNTIFICLLTLAACTGPPAGQALEAVDPGRLTIYHNGVVLTMDPARPTAQAIAVRGEMIEAVGSNQEILAMANGGATMIDLDGRVLMPGFVDAHTHLLNDARSQGWSLDQAQTTALRHGITTIGDLYIDEGDLLEIRAFADAGYLRIRTGLYLVAVEPCGSTLGDWWKEFPPTNTPGEMLRINGVKIFTDGGSCGGVALSFELELGAGLGDLWFTQEELDALVAEVDAAGYQAAVHAIGDRAVHQALNAMEAVLDGRPNTLRHRMEHVSVIATEDLPRFGELGVIPVLMGEYPMCTPYGPPLPAEFGQMEWPWRALREANPDLTLAWHTDVPFQSIDPFDHLLGFTTRIDRLDRSVCQPYPWLLDNTLPPAEALSIMTIQSAVALRRETEVGSLVPGKYADLIVLETNPLEAEIERIGENRVLLTVVGGRVEFCSQGNAGLCPGYTPRRPALIPDNRPPVPVRWLGLMLVTLAPAAAMLARRRRPDRVRRIGGAAGMIGGLAWVFVLLQGFPTAEESIWLIMSLPLFLFALGTAGLAAGPTQGRLAAVGHWLMLLGALATAAGVLLGEWFRLEASWLLIFVGILVHTIGLVLFGIGGLRGRAPASRSWLPLAMGVFGGLVPLLGSSLAGQNSDLPLILLLAIVGGGWVGLGWMMLTKRPLGSLRP